MSKFSELKDSASRMSRKWAGLIIVGVLVLAALFIVVPQLNFWFSAYWGYQSFRELFYEHLHLSDAMSTFWARVLAFGYAFAWTPLLLVAYRRDSKQIAIAFVCYAFVFGMIPLLKGVFGTEICFNQQTGNAEKWYVKNRDGTITLYDSPGYDSFGVAKRPVTTEVCLEYQALKSNAVPHLLTADPRTLEWFNAIDSSPKVFYDIAPDGSYRLFDGPGFDPDTSEALRPATNVVRMQVIKKQQRSEEDAKTAKEAADAAAAQAQKVADEAALQEKKKAEAIAAKEAKHRVILEGIQGSLNCVAGSPCTFQLADDGATTIAYVPLGKNPCFDRSFWNNIDRLGYETSYHGSQFTAYSCTKEQLKAGQCAARYLDSFRFRPQPGVPLPRYWFVGEGARHC